jgi:hypothetical protein
MLRRLDPPYQTRLGAGRQYVVDGLGGHRPELLGHPVTDLAPRSHEGWVTNHCSTD